MFPPWLPAQTRILYPKPSYTRDANSTVLLGTLRFQREVKDNDSGRYERHTTRSSFTFSFLQYKYQSPGQASARPDLSRLSSEYQNTRLDVTAPVFFSFVRVSPLEAGPDLFRDFNVSLFMGHILNYTTLT